MSKEEIIVKNKSVIIGKAICLKTYPDEDDMHGFVDGEIKPHEVKIYLEGNEYEVVSEHYDPEYWKLLKE